MRTASTAALRTEKASAYQGRPKTKGSTATSAVDDDVVRMREETVRSGPHQRRAGQHDDARRDEVRDLEVVEPEGERAQFERDEEHGRSWPRLGELGRDGEAADAAGAAAAEDRHAQHVVAKAHAAEHPRVELGVAMPVDDSVTTVSTSAPVSPACASAAVDASINSASAPSR